jgi:prepilin-type N-terminal cleavage/methylation domain-containing protein
MSRSDRKAGFTLLEVMAAVALLAILYTVLARVAIEGLRAEGESARRLDAALLADARIAESFTNISGNFVLPEFGHQETTEGDFKLALDVAPFRAPAEWGLDEAAGSLIFASEPGVQGTQALREVQLTVSWLEGAEPRQISRTLYVMDFERISSLASSAEQSGGGSNGNAQTPEAESPELQLPEELPSELEAP